MQRRKEGKQNLGGPSTGRRPEKPLAAQTLICESPISVQKKKRRDKLWKSEVMQ
jgi:hypothetical protein